MDLRERAKPDPQSREEVQRWALVGAYERDNMGDFLLLRATELLLARPGRNLVRTAPFTPAPGVMAPERVVRWSDELSARPAAVVWTVGGAVGAVSPQRAWSMSAPPAAWSSFRATPPDERQSLLADLLGADPAEHPLAYAPDPRALLCGARAVRVMNSADLTALGVLPPRSARGILEDLHRIPLISVRDADSQALCREHGIAADLAPDMVHTLLGKVRDLPAPRSLPVLLQVSDAHLSRVGADALLDPLASSPTVSQTGVAIMCAGTASGHDSFEKAEELAAGLTERKIGVTIVRERQPEALLRLIAGSTAVVATSLHLRILACAHAVPRVSLPIAKVTCYARTWDDRMPFDVAAPDLAEALDVALAAGPTDQQDLGRQLADMAERSALALAQRAEEMCQDRWGVSAPAFSKPSLSEPSIAGRA
jgi:hypothetical protein avisC_08157